MEVTKSDFWKNVTRFSSRNYLNERLDKLVTVGMLKLEEGGMETNFDNIVVILHKLFPEKFSLMSFPEYPDSIRVDNTLRLDCRHSKFLNGNRVKGFRLTTLGKITAEDTLEFLNSKTSDRKGKQKTEVSDKRRNRAVRSITSVIESEAFQKFSQKQLAEIKKFDVCEVLHGTLDTREETLRINLNILKQFANDMANSSQYKDLSSKAISFFNYLEKNWELLMHE